MNTPNIPATIYENGNGLPKIGSLCYDSSTDTVYVVESWDGSSSIATHGLGQGNSVNVLLRPVGCAADTTDEEWEEIESSNFSVSVES